jgi:hypothetical protein
VCFVLSKFFKDLNSDMSVFKFQSSVVYFRVERYVYEVKNLFRTNSIVILYVSVARRVVKELRP